MNWSERERLYNLLPAIHRIRDGAAGEPLRALLSVIESELETIEGDIEGLYDNWFIETCDSWVIPYLGDLVANRPLHDVGRPLRADVAKTISYRRRKATVPMLAELANDVTGWEAHVVEFFQLLAWTQNVNHVRFALSPNPVPFAGVPPERLNPSAVNRVGTVNFRHHDTLDRIDGPFDEVAHTVDIRPPCLTRDRYNIRKVGVYLWRLQSYEMEKVTPAPSANAVDGGTTFGFHFSPLGADAPLFNRPQAPDAGQPARIVDVHVSGPVRPLALHLDLERGRTEHVAGAASPASDYVGDERAIVVMKGQTPIPPENIVVMDLETWHRPPSTVMYPRHDGTEPVEIEAGIDPRRGRIVFAPGHEPDDVHANPDALTVSYHFGFSADLGGGPYRRDLDSEAGDGAEPTWSKTVSLRLGAGQADFGDLNTALDDWAGLPAVNRRKAVLTILDNATYPLSRTIAPASDEQLVIQAGSGSRPTIQVTAGGPSGGELEVGLPPEVEGDGGSLVLSGLLIEGGVWVKGPLRTLDVLHSTLVPGRRLNELGEPVAPDAASITVDPGNSRLDITIDRSIVGPLRLPEDVKSLLVRDSIIDALPHLDPTAAKAAISRDSDGTKPGPATTLQRVTVLGGVNVRQLTLASEVVFTQPVLVQRRQAGCVRFSYVPPESNTPRRYRCQPDLAIAPTDAEAVSRMAPSFTSTRYGDPGYVQLRRACPVEIRQGAEDGSEMGVFALLKQPQREANLRQRLEEYLPFGLEAALLFVT